MNGFLFLSGTKTINALRENRLKGVFRGDFFRRLYQKLIIADATKPWLNQPDKHSHLQIVIPFSADKDFHLQHMIPNSTDINLWLRACFYSWQSRFERATRSLATFARLHRPLRSLAPQRSTSLCSLRSLALFTGSLTHFAHSLVRRLKFMNMCSH